MRLNQERVIIVALDKQKGVDHMPGPFTHIYTQRRVSEFLKSSPQTGGVNENFVRSGDGANAKNDLGLDLSLIHI